MSRSYIFGPVASRRLGVSLGVDLVEPKSCPLNCVYCEAGKTTLHTLERREYVPVELVMEQLRERLKDNPRLDYITFSGAGEPTLNSGLGKVVNFLKDNYPQYKLCLLTNGCLLDDSEVIAELSRVDVVVPSLDCSNEEEYRKINDPVGGSDFASLLRGIRRLCASYGGEIDLELFIVPGVNDSDESIGRFAEIMRSLPRLAKVQLNTLDRPGIVGWIKPSPPENTNRFIRALEPIVPVEAVGVFRYKSAALRKSMPHTEMACRILELCARRPATTADLMLALDMEQEQMQKMVNELVNCGQLSAEREKRGEFYRTV